MLIEMIDDKICWEQMFGGCAKGKSSRKFLASITVI